MNQSDFAEVAGVTRKTLFNYEKGDRAPDASALAAWAHAGLDVLYVVLGEQAKVAVTRPLAPKEQVILEAFRAGTSEQQDFILKAALGFAGTDSGGVQQVVHGDQAGQMAGGNISGSNRSRGKKGA